MKTLLEIGQSIPNHTKLESPLVENFLPIYEKYWSHLRHQPITLLEIGIGKGGSPKIWREYFPNAKIVAGDFDRNKFYDLSGVSFEYVNQDDHQSIKNVASKHGPFDIIIDDGGHQIYQQINSLILLWEHIKSPGMYIVEDLNTSYWSGFGGGYGKLNTVNFLKTFIDNLNAMFSTVDHILHQEEWVKIKQKDDPYENSPIPQHIPNINDTLEYIHFYKALAILGKHNVG